MSRSLENIDRLRTCRASRDDSSSYRTGSPNRFSKLTSLASCALTLLLSGGPTSAQSPKSAPYNSKDRQPTPEELAAIPPVFSPEKAAQLLSDVRFPEEFNVTIFATPPAVNYPVFVSAAPDGTLYVSSDGNGSLDRKAHLGRVLRVRDTDGDGKADEVKALVPDVDSPRGLVWDHDRLYLLHPPHISVYIDEDGDGVAERQQILVKNIAFGFKDRPADHSSNGLELGIDGWLYAAIGDFGFMEAQGTDGRKLQLRAGGVVRVRPDGTGLELFARGTRNILEVAISPLLDGFARDNTNDGGGWDVRFHHFTPLAEHGYPALFKNFGDEIIQPLADFGGGSGCGAAWIDEPGIPAKWNNAPFTADWGRERVYHHALTPSGATFKADQTEFCKLPRVTDLDVDASGAIYAASWKGASFTWVGPEVGFIARAIPKAVNPEPLPNFKTASDASLVTLLESGSHRRRMEAQRTLVRRGLNAQSIQSIEALASDKTKPLASRVAAVFGLKQARGADSTAFLAALTQDETIAPWTVRALADRLDQLQGVSAGAVAAGLRSKLPRLRRESAAALARLGDLGQASSLTSLLADSDPQISHTAVQCLSLLKASDACFAVLDKPDAQDMMRSGAIRVLQSIHEPEVVSGLLNRLSRETFARKRENLLTALCRLHFVEGSWTGDSWGTRPDTRGPYYQPAPWSETPRIVAALKQALEKAAPAEAAFIGRELARHRIPAGDALDTLIARAASEPSLLPAIAMQLAEADSIPTGAVALLIKAAEADTTPDAARAQAVIALSKSEDPQGWAAILRALPLVQATKTENNLAEKARSAFFNSSKLDTQHALFDREASKLDGQPSILAEAMLLKLAARKIGSAEAREFSAKALDAGWSITKRKVQIMKAATMAGESSRAALFIAALSDPDPEVALTAKQTVKQLKIDPAKFRSDTQALKVADLPVESAVASVLKLKGDALRGEQIFAQIGCGSCHTTKADEPLKGPFLGNVASIYKRVDIAEAILIPNKTLAQGFIANHFELKDGSEVDGFVVLEAADAVTIRTITAQEQRIPLSQIVTREKQQKSLMPEGLVSSLPMNDFASLLDFLQSLSEPKK